MTILWMDLSGPLNSSFRVSMTESKGLVPVEDLMGRYVMAFCDGMASRLVKSKVLQNVCAAELTSPWTLLGPAR